MAEFASKGVSGTALGLGIAGTVGLVNSMSQNGLLGGLFGGGNQVEDLRAENTLLKANQYSDMQNGGIQAEICSLSTKVAVQEEQIAAMKREAELRDQLTDCKIAKVADAANCGITSLQGSVSALQQTVSCIVKTYIPNSAIVPTTATTGA